MSRYEAVNASEIIACLQSDGNLAITEGIAAIGPYAFSNCADLTEITAPDSLMLIGWNAFANTPWLDSRPDGMVYTGKVAYTYKGEMPPDTRIVLRDGTTGIAGGAFCNYKSLVGITIPEGVKTIGNIAFLNCENLKDIDIPDSVWYIEPLAFEYTAWLGNRPDGMVYAGKVAYAFKGTMPRNAHIVIKDGTVSITAEAFAHADKLHRLSSVTIPDSVTYIGENQFADCTEDYGINITIRCNKNSYAYYYAKNNGVKIEII